MVAHYHGQIWNHAEPARSLGVSEPTIRRYLDALTGVFMIRQLPPWHENLAKRQIKAPKVYLRDSGLLHHLLGIRTHADLLRHPKLGASWEGYVVEQILRASDRTRRTLGHVEASARASAEPAQMAARSPRRRCRSAAAPRR